MLAPQANHQFLLESVQSLDANFLLLHYSNYYIFDKRVTKFFVRI